MFASLSPSLRALFRAHGVIDRNNDAFATSGTGNNGDGIGSDDDVVVIDDLDDALEWCEEQVGAGHINTTYMPLAYSYSQPILPSSFLIRFSAASATYEVEEVTMITMVIAILTAIQRRPHHLLLLLRDRGRGMVFGDCVVSCATTSRSTTPPLTHTITTTTPAQP